MVVNMSDYNYSFPMTGLKTAFPPTGKRIGYAMVPVNSHRIETPRPPLPENRSIPFEVPLPMNAGFESQDSLGTSPQEDLIFLKNHNPKDAMNTLLGGMGIGALVGAGAFGLTNYLMKTPEPPKTQSVFTTLNVPDVSHEFNQLLTSGIYAGGMILAAILGSKILTKDSDSHLRAHLEYLKSRSSLDE